MHSAVEPLTPGAEAVEPPQARVGEGGIAQRLVAGLLGQPQESGRAGVELGAEEHVGVGGIVELVRDLAGRRPVGAEPGQGPSEPRRRLAGEVDAGDVAQGVGELQEPQVLPGPEGGAVHRLAGRSAAVGQDGGAEAVDDRLHPRLRPGVLAQQVEGGHAEVPVVDDGVVPAFPRVALPVHLRPPAFQEPHEAGASLALLGRRQIPVEQVEGQGEGLHVAVGRVEVLLHGVRRGPQPAAARSQARARPSQRRSPVIRQAKA